MDSERFRDSCAGRLMRVGQGESAYLAFIPNPLPPSLAPDWELACYLSDADRALSELAGIGRTMPNPHLLIGPFMRREAVLSSRIEGTQADVMDLYAYEVGQLPLPGMQSAPPESDIQEVLNYVHALEYGLERLSSLPVSLRLIRELHERLLAGVRDEHAGPGEFRARQNWIGSPGCGLGDATYVPPPFPQMHETLDALERYLHSDDGRPPLVRLALFHYQFEAIHPFVDGNGRMGRLLLSLLLVEWKLMPVPLLHLSAYFHGHRQHHYDLLLAVSERGAWHDWLVFFLRGVSEQAQDAILRAKKLQDLQAAWRERLISPRGSALPLSLVECLFASPVLTITDAQRLLGVTYHSARSAVCSLVSAGILRQVGQSSYGKTYIAPEILDIVSELH